MNIKKIYAIFFSPTDSTKKVISTIAKDLSLPVENIDITSYSKKLKAYNFKEDELVIFGVPVYGGRIPEPAARYIKKIKATNALSTIIVTYGNRDYDDALLELKDITEANGFITLSAAAFVTEHSIMHSVAHGRPDKKDLDIIHKFVKNTWSKIQNINSISDIKPLKVKGNKPYKEYKGIPLKPTVSKACTKCKACALKCPVNAIDISKPNTTNKNLCISCMRCIKVCPTHARKLNKLILTQIEKIFYMKYNKRKEIETFI